VAYRQLATGEVVNDDGLVAMQYTISENNKHVIMEGSGGDYFFTSIHHVNLAWVKRSDMTMLLTIQEKSCNCNNGTYKPAFQLATLANVNIYTTGNM
jgi:hypothetical protein